MSSNPFYTPGPRAYVDTLLDKIEDEKLRINTAFDNVNATFSVLSPTVVIATNSTGVVITAGSWVNLYDNAGVLSIRLANASSASGLLAHGYVLTDVSNGHTVGVYVGGMNTKVPLGSFVAADIGKQVFLAKTPGAMTLDVSGFSAGDLVQPLGFVDAVGITVSVTFLPESGFVIE